MGKKINNNNHIVLYNYAHWALFEAPFNTIRGKQGRCQKML
jgi:hypothetical protein